MVDCFGADDEVVAVYFDLAPDGGGGLLWETADVNELALLCDFREGCAIFLADGDELTAGALVGPA